MSRLHIFLLICILTIITLFFTFRRQRPDSLLSNSAMMPSAEPTQTPPIGSSSAYTNETLHAMIVSEGEKTGIQSFSSQYNPPEPSASSFFGQQLRAPDSRARVQTAIRNFISLRRSIESTRPPITPVGGNTPTLLAPPPSTQNTGVPLENPQ